MKLYDIAHSRTGDKGDISTISIIAYNPDDYPMILEQITEEKVLSQFKAIGATKVTRYELPLIYALNFVIENTLGGGVTRSLALDSHGKALSFLILELDII